MGFQKILCLLLLTVYPNSSLPAEKLIRDYTPGLQITFEEKSIDLQIEFGKDIILQKKTETNQIIIRHPEILENSEDHIIKKAEDPSEDVEDRASIKSSPTQAALATSSSLQAGVITASVMFVVILLMFIALFIYLHHDVFEKKFGVLKNKLKQKEKPSSMGASKSVKTSEFIEHTKRLLEQPIRLKEEYQELSSQVRKSCNVGKKPENSWKNRYVNIIPYDETRVILPKSDLDLSSTDYINANYIKGHSGKIEYIAAQGPKVDTCYDFWKMIYHEHVPAIYMLTGLVEHGTEKCHKYYPDVGEEIIYQNMKVKCTLIEETEVFVKRSLEVSLEDERWSLVHYHVREWGDFGVPASTDIMIQLCDNLRENVAVGKVVIHCSAGVGRTGTMIAIDILLQNLKKGEKVNVFETVSRLREQRSNMVQTSEQYSYIYKCLLDYLTKSDKV